MSSKRLQFGMVFVGLCKEKISQAKFERLSVLYDRLYEEAGLILARHDPCKIEKGRCFEGNPCCDDCGYLSKKKGCTVKSLICKLFLCNEARKKFPQCAAALDVLKKIAAEKNLLVFRSSREDIFSQYEVINK